MTDNPFIPARDFAMRYGLNPRAYGHLERRGGVFVACRQFGHPQYHTEQVRLADMVKVGAMTEAQAAQEWDEFKKVLGIKPLSVLPGRRKSHAS